MQLGPTLRGGTVRAWNARAEVLETGCFPASRKTSLSLRIRHDEGAAGAYRNLRTSSDRVAVAMRRLSSGLRINSGADDAAGLGIAERMRSQVRGLEVANRNIQDGISLIDTMDAALDAVHSILHRARDLAVQFNNGTNDTAARIAIRDELFALSDEIARIEQTTQFNGMPLLQNAATVITLQVGANDAEVIPVTLVDLFGAGLSLVRSNTFMTIPLPWFSADITGMDMHIADVATARARLGAASNRLEHARAANEATQSATMAAESRIRDVDVALEVTNLARQKILQQGAAAMLRQANLSSRRVLDLLE